jgi:hypothetical protein
LFKMDYSLFLVLKSVQYVLSVPISNSGAATSARGVFSSII